MHVMMELLNCFDGGFVTFEQAACEVSYPGVHSGVDESLQSRKSTEGRVGLAIHTRSIERWEKVVYEILKEGDVLENVLADCQKYFTYKHKPDS